MLSRPSEEYAGQVVELDAQQRADFIKEAQEAGFALSSLADFASEPALSRELAFNILSATESRLAQLSQLAGVEMESANAREARYGELRRANTRIRDLERQLGTSVGPATVLPAVAVLCEKVKRWWADKGFGHVSEATVGPYGMSVKLSCYLCLGSSWRKRRSSTGDDSEEQWREQLRQQGFELVLDRRDGWAVAASSHNQARLEALVFETFPSARLVQFSAHMTGGRGDGTRHNTLRELELFLPELSEVAALPGPQEA